GDPQCIKGNRCSTSKTWVSTTATRQPEPNNCRKEDTDFLLKNETSDQPNSMPTSTNAMSDFSNVTFILRQLPRIKIPAIRVLSYPFRALVLARLPKSSGGHDERTEGAAHCHHQGRGPEIDRGQEKGVSSPRNFGLPQRQCSASSSRVWLVP